MWAWSSGLLTFLIHHGHAIIHGLLPGLTQLVSFGDPWIPSMIQYWTSLEIFFLGWIFCCSLFIILLAGVMKLFMHESYVNSTWKCKIFELIGIPERSIAHTSMPLWGLISNYLWVHGTCPLILSPSGWSLVAEIFHLRWHICFGIFSENCPTPSSWTLFVCLFVLQELLFLYLCCHTSVHITKKESLVVWLHQLRNLLEESLMLFSYSLVWHMTCSFVLLTVMDAVDVWDFWLCIRYLLLWVW